MPQPQTQDTDTEDVPRHSVAATTLQCQKLDGSRKALIKMTCKCNEVKLIPLYKSPEKNYQHLANKL